MIEEKLVIEIDGRQVLSELRCDESRPHVTIVWITSTSGEHSAVNSHSIWHRAGYSQEQAAYDIEQARFQFAGTLAGKASIRSMLPALIAPPGGDGPRVIAEPERPKPIIDDVTK